MGTSSARRAPTGRLWRLAKAAATRYLSPEAAGAVDAREVAARYLAALGEGGEPGFAGPLAAFRLTRKVAQNLGAFGCRAGSQGWPAALSAWGLPEPPPETPEVIAPPLAAALGAAGGGLEEAVAHSALSGVLQELPDAAALEAPQLVRRFLVHACAVRLTLDLGASLEAAAPGFSALRLGLSEIAGCLSQAAAADPSPKPAPPTPDAWLGLSGWTWVTETMEALLSRLSAPPD